MKIPERLTTENTGFNEAKNPITGPNSDIIRRTKYRNAPGSALTLRGLTQEVSAPMCSKSIPNSANESIPHGVRWSPADQCYLVPLSRGKYARVDLEDLGKVAPHKWTALKGKNGNWYAYRTDRKNGAQKSVFLHRFILEAPQGAFVDHINHDGLDNRRSNLRMCSHQENNVNRRGPQANNTSGYLGVSWNRRAQKWRAYISSHGKRHYVGWFDDPVEAARSRDVAALELHGEFAALNFPELREVLS